MPVHPKQQSKKTKAAIKIEQFGLGDHETQKVLSNSETWEYLQGFVKLPKPMPEDEWESAKLQTHCLAEEGEIRHAMIFIEAAMHSFRRDKDPLTALRVFLDSMENGFYPPVEILEFLLSAFFDYWKNQGNKSMDKAMNLVAGKGQTPPFKRALMQERDLMLMMDIDLLMSLGFSREKAAEAVTAKLKREDWNKTFHEMADIDAETIADRHKRAHRPQTHSVEPIKKLYRLDTEEGVRAYLSRFPDLPRS